MAANQSFYEVLQVPRDANPDQIRKAYKKQALLTHPDRLPVGHTPADKRAAEEQFRKVSNAYEVLKDPENKRLYDTHGVWPPPTPPEQQQQHHPYSRPPSHRPYPRPNRHNAPFPDPFQNFFTEPFTLFDSMFSDYRRRPSHRDHFNRRDPFEAMYRLHDMLADLERDMFSSSPFPSAFPPPPLVGFNSSPFGNRGQIRWAQESTMFTSTNGVTQSIHKRRDWDGNEHVTRTYPDGREVYTINGVEQPSNRGYLPPSSPPPPPRNIEPPPPQMNAPRGYISPPPSYHGSRSRHSSHPGYNDHAPNEHRRDRRSQGEFGASARYLGPNKFRAAPVIPADPGPVIPNMNAPRADRPRRWWHGGNGR
ncbi:hypothetical protein C8J57DRAFT_85692 [Mycena rebaudengoi]|nr:hypothetical protein C8J57DRAFT_85692 [Mycena rebaudengoi]